jgi:hypothetical protein
MLMPSLRSSSRGRLGVICSWARSCKTHLERTELHIYKSRSCLPLQSAFNDEHQGRVRDGMGSTPGRDEVLAPLSSFSFTSCLCACQADPMMDGVACLKAASGKLAQTIIPPCARFCCQQSSGRGPRSVSHKSCAVFPRKGSPNPAFIKAFCTLLNVMLMCARKCV